MSILLDEAFEAIEAALHRARKAIEDEHEKDLREALGDLYLTATEAYDLVQRW